MTPRPGWNWLLVGQDMRILTSQPGNWNGWIFCNHGDGATMVLYTMYTYIIHQYTTTSVSTVQLWHVTIAAWHLRTIAMRCENFREAPSITITAIHPNRNV